MKKLLIGLFIFSAFFAGSSQITHADIFQDAIDGAQNLAENVAKKGGEISRDVTEFNLKLEYFARPFKEKNLSFEEWLSLYGHSTFGAGPIPRGDLSLPNAAEFGEVGANTDLRSFILNVLNWILSFLGLICVAMVIYAGYLYIITGGEDGHEKGKKILLYVAVGIFVILISYALVNTLIRSTTEGGDNFEAIQTSLSSDLEKGEIIVSGGNAVDYGSGYIVDTGQEITFTTQSENGNIPEDLQWSFGDGTIDVSSETISKRTFFDEGFKNVIVIGKIKDAEEVEHDYMASVKVLTGASVIANFMMTPANPGVDEDINFDASTSQAIVGLIESYEWTCESTPSSVCDSFVPPSNDNEVDATFSEIGEVTITLTVNDNLENSATFFQTFNVSGQSVNNSIEASFNVSTVNAIVNNQVEFSGIILPRNLIANSYTWECQEIGGASANICTEFNNDSGDGVSQFYSSFPEIGDVKISLVVENNGTVSVPFEKILSVSEPGSTIAVEGSSSTSQISSSVLDFNSPQAIWTEEDIVFSAKNNGEEDFALYKWTFVDGEEEGESVTRSFDSIGESTVKLEALNEDGEIIETKEKNVLVAEKNSPIPVLSINGSNVFPNDQIEVLLGNVLDFEKNSFDGSGNQGDTAKVTHSWILNGSVVNESSLSELSSSKGIHQIKVNAISTVDSNKRTSLQFKIKVANETPEMNLLVNESSLGAGFFTMKADITTENTIAKQYKFEVLEKGKVISTQVVNSLEQSVETIVDVSSKMGEHNYVFQVTMIDQDNMAVKKSVAKNVIIEEEEVTNNKPVVEIFATPATSGLTSTMFKFYTQASDEDNDFLTYKWEFPNGKKIIGKTASHKFLDPGNNTVKVTVSDGLSEVSATETITVEEDLNIFGQNTPPVIISSGISPGNTGDTTTVFKLYAFAEDSDGDELDYSWIMGDGNRIDLQNVSYTYSLPGKYLAKLIVSDGIKTITKAISISIVDKGETIPDSTAEDYEEVNDVSNDEGFSSEDLSINSNIDDQNIQNFLNQLEEALLRKEAELVEASNATLMSEEEIADLIKSINDLHAEYVSTTDPVRKAELLSEINEKEAELVEASNATLMSEEEIADLIKSINDLHAEYVSTTDPVRKAELLSEINEKEAELSSEREKLDNIIKLKKEIKLINSINSLLNEYNATSDPTKRKNLLNIINQKKLELELLDPTINFVFIGLEGKVNTNFFFYSKIPKSNRPVLIRWNTGDGRSFIGQNVSWKYPEIGEYIVQMEISDGVSTLNDSINIKIK